MGVSQGGVPSEAPWQVRIRNADRVLGAGRAVDHELSDQPDSEIDVAFVQQIESWLRGRRRIRLIVTGESASATATTLRRVIRFADRESQPSTGDRSVAAAEEGTIPPVGSVDLALDVSGRTVDEVSGRIADRLGIPTGESGTVTGDLRTEAAPMTLVIDGVDDVAEPEVLLNEVLAPLAERGVRLLLGFHRDSSSALRIARSQWPDQDKPDDHPDLIRRRIDGLTTRIGDVADREEALGNYRRQVTAGITDAPELRPRSASLRFWLSALRKTNVDGGQGWLQRQLDDCETTVEQVLRELHELQRSLDELWHKVNGMQR